MEKMNEELFLAEVLPRCRARDVLRWKAVSKSWGSYLSSMEFSRWWFLAHRPWSMSELLQQRVPSRKHVLQVSAHKRDLNVLCCSNGYVCCLLTTPDDCYRLGECGTRGLIYGNSPGSVLPYRPNISLVVCNPVFEQTLPRLVIPDQDIICHQYVNMVVDVERGFYKVGVLAGTWVAAYDSRKAQWRVRRNTAMPKIDVMNLNFESCVYRLSIRKYQLELFAYDFVGHRWGSLDVPWPANSHGIKAFVYRSRCFSANLNPERTMIVISELKNRAWVKASTLRVGNKRRGVIIFKLEGNMLFAILASRSGGVVPAGNRCKYAVLNMDDFTWILPLGYHQHNYRPCVDWVQKLMCLM